MCVDNSQETYDNKIEWHFEFWTVNRGELIPFTFEKSDHKKVVETEKNTERLRRGDQVGWFRRKWGWIPNGNGFRHNSEHEKFYLTGEGEVKKK